MNSSELALKILEWEKLQTQADNMGKEIAAVVIKLEKSQNVGNVTATFTKGRGRYDYEAAAQRNELDMEEYKTVVTNYDYRQACKDAEIDLEPYYEQTSGPSVSLRIKK